MKECRKTALYITSTVNSRYYVKAEFTRHDVYAFPERIEKSARVWQPTEHPLWQPNSQNNLLYFVLGEGDTLYIRLGDVPECRCGKYEAREGAIHVRGERNMRLII